MQELRRQLADEQTQSHRIAEAEGRKQALLRQILTPEARERLGRIRLVRAEFVEQLELQLIQAAQSGRIQLPINDTQLKELLAKLQTQRSNTSLRG